VDSKREGRTNVLNLSEDFYEYFNVQKSTKENKSEEEQEEGK